MGDVWTVKQQGGEADARWIVRRDGPIGIDVVLCFSCADTPTPIAFCERRAAELVAEELNAYRARMAYRPPSPPEGE